MAGGNWTAQNKVRPGIYINFKSGESPVAAQGTRGTVAIPRVLSWGPMGQVTVVNAGEDTRGAVGYAATEPGALFLRELFKGTNVTGGPAKVLLYRLEAQGAETASAVISGAGSEPFTATALYPGVRGNSLAVSVAEAVDDPGSFIVTTLLDGTQVDRQQVKAADGLAANGWITFSETGALAATAGVALTGGADGTVQSAAYAGALTALEPYSFDILAYDGTDSTVREAMAAFVKRLAEQEGRYSQLVTSGAKNADSPYVISTSSGVILSDGTQLAANEVVWWLAGAQAGAQYDQSLSYAAYPGAADVATRQTNGQIEAAILAGDIVLVREFGQVRVETDINTLVTYTPGMGKAFRKNTTMRVCCALANDIYRDFSLNFRGKVKNNADGRGLFKSAILSRLLEMYGKGALRERPAGGDVSVEQGDELDSIVVTLGIWVGDSVEKAYLTITVA